MARKFAQLKNSLNQLSVTDGPNFQENAIPLLKLSHERMVLARRLRNNDLINNNEDFNERISKFKSDIRSIYD